MYNGIIDLHNLLRWVILVLIVVAIIKSFNGMRNRNAFTKGDKKIGLFLMIAAHTQFLIGLYQWFAGPWGLKAIQQLGMGEVMKNPVYRYWTVEHTFGMLAAIVLITIGRGVGKKSISDRSKHNKTFWYYTIALLLMLATIPWPGRTGIGRPLVPGTHQVSATPEG